jgi:hypothetical protein
MESTRETVQPAMGRARPVSRSALQKERSNNIVELLAFSPASGSRRAEVNVLFIPPAVIPQTTLHEVRYSIFDSALDRKPETKWLFAREKATLNDLQTATYESKML